MHTDRATPGTLSKANESLQSLPEPSEKVVAAVYRFRDQTGQYKPSERVASWSTAVTQGATSILIKAMEDSGWFVPIERESISNLLNERQIIQSIRQQHSGPEGPDPLPPLLFAGVMLDGGIIGYDTNVITGGAGLRYLATGGSNMYRKDQVTIYLRAVSTQSGRVLKTVHTTKSILSQQLEGGAFRYIDTNRLLEAEAGFTYNEPPVMAVTEAIDEAVKLLILEGIDEGIWSAESNDEVLAYRENFKIAKQQEERLRRDYFGLDTEPSLRKGMSFGLGGLMGSYIGNYNSPKRRAGYSLQIENSLNKNFTLKTNFQRTEIGVNQVFLTPLNTGDLLLNVYATPNYKLSPFMGAGAGVLMFDKKYDFLEQQFFPAASFEIGLDYRFNSRFGLRLNTQYRYLLQDGLDGVSEGRYNDQQWNLNLSLILKPNFF
ncbi:MAG: CsgG/HfaB family protein [Balneolaceae bacterium]|nr:CsgG/HfaB family protein [Balneolaceae bacterium]MDR9408025.1 CsgG/HfaB family protein [Balneolaceae bacterium]